MATEKEKEEKEVFSMTECTYDIKEISEILDTFTETEAGITSKRTTMSTQGEQKETETVQNDPFLLTILKFSPSRKSFTENYKSDEPNIVTKVDKLQLKCGNSDENIVNATGQPTKKVVSV